MKKAIENLHMILDEIKESEDAVCYVTDVDAEPLEMAIKALEKQIPRKPVYEDYDDNGFEEIIPHTAKCPICGYEFEFGTWNEFENHHCPCGQLIDWEDTGSDEH